MRTARTTAFVAATAFAASCARDVASGPPRATASAGSSLTAAPSLGTFLIYAERSVTMGAYDVATGGDIGVNSAAVATFGTQLSIGRHTFVDPSHDISAPSVALADDALVGDVETDALQDNGATVGAVSPFPAAAMPPLPFAAAPITSGLDVNVPAFTIRTLPPGQYGSLTVEGVALLGAGSYSFSSIAVGDGAHVVTEHGPTNVNVANALSIGRWASVSPAAFHHAGSLTLLVAGSDGSKGAPVVSIGEHSEVAALLAAPRGTMAMGEGVVAAGAFAAFDVRIGDHVAVAFESGFTATAPGQTGTQLLSGYVGGPASTAPLLGPVPPTTVLAMAVGVPAQNMASLQTFVQQVSDPTSPTYRHYLTTAQFAAGYGAAAPDYQAVISWAETNNLTVTQYENRLLLDVSGAAGDFERALHVSLNYRQRADGSAFYAPDRDPSVDLTVPLLHITAVDNYVLPQPLGGSGTGGLYLSSDLRTAYAGCTTLIGTGQTIGILSFDGVTASGITAYETAAGLAGVPAVQTQLLNKFSGTPSYKAGTTESTADIELAIAMAPGAQVVVFEGTNLDSILSAMATANPLPAQLSSSWGPNTSKNTPQLMYELAAQGQSFFQSSGDSGGYPPDPTDIRALTELTLVGGTVLSMNGSGASYQSETAWSGSGGGSFTGQSIPSYQVGIDMSQNGGSTTSRNAPDVAMMALSAEAVVTDSAGNNQTISWNGTSVSAPLFAGLMALANQQGASLHLPNVGFANPLLYEIATTSSYATSFNDITTGSSTPGTGATGFSATAGYDLVTGLGTPKCGLINAISPIPPPPTAITISATETQTGPDLCTHGTGFTAGATVHLTYTNIPGRSAPAAGASGTVLHDGSFSITDTSQDFGTLVGICTNAQIQSDVTITASDGTVSSTATMPGAYWCANAPVSTNLNGGCP